MPITPTAAFEFHPSLMLREEYSDNFFLDNGPGRENFRTVLGPGFTLFANTARTHGTANARLDLTFDTAQGARRTNFFPNLTANFEHELTPRLKLILTESLASGDDSSQTDRTGLRAPERRQYYSNAATLAAEWQVDLVNLRAFYGNSYIIGSTTTGQSRNLQDGQMTHVVGVGASAPIGGQNTVRASYELSLGQGTTDSIGHFVSASFERQVNAFTTAGISTSFSTQSHDDSQTYNISVYTAYNLPSGFSVSGRLGWTWFRSNGDDDSGPSVSTTVAYLLGQWLLSLGVFADFRQSFTQGEDVGVVFTRTVSASASGPITPATRLSLNVSYSENEPTGSGNNRNFDTSRYLLGSAAVSTVYVTAGVRASHGENQFIGPINNPSGQAKRTITAGAWVSVPLGTWLSLMLDYNYLDRDDGGGLPHAKENRASATLQASF